MSLNPFHFIELPPERSLRKPRRTGLTMMIDWGLPLARQKDLLDLAGPYIDFAKIAVGTSRLYSAQYLRRKLDLYKKNAVRPFLGGQFQEYVFATQGSKAIEPFLREAQRVGFELVEVSDNVVPLKPRQRREQIRLAIDCGLSVLGEVGSKSKQTAAQQLIAQAEDCFQAGAEMVLVEGAELVDKGRPRSTLIRALKKGLDFSRVLIELPGPWVSGTSLCDVHDLKKFLVRELGPDVNLANIMPDDVIETESLRVGLGVVGPSLTAAKKSRKRKARGQT